MQIFDYNGCGVYKILNNISGKCYIGISKHCQERIKQHVRELKHNRHTNNHLQRAWNKYGEESFICSVIEKFDLSEVDKTHVLLREIYWIDFYNSCENGYNQSHGGDGSTFVQLSKERNEKISKAIRGRKQPWNTRGRSFNARRIVCLNTGKNYECIADAVDEYNSSCPEMIRSCKSRLALNNKCHHVFMYYEDYSKLSKDEICEIIANAEFIKQNKWDLAAKSVVCLNNGELFESGKLAAKKYHAEYSSLLKCCKGLTASAGKFESGEPLAWMFLTDYKNASKQEIAYKIRIALIKGNHNKPVKLRCVTTGETFEATAHAAKKYNLSQITLARHVKSDGVCGIHPVTKEKLVWEIID